jgi:DNA-directed RNA polymerase specialized sigma24 family protein
LRLLNASGKYEGRKYANFKVPDASPLKDEELLRRKREEAFTCAIELLEEKFRVSLLLFAAGKSYGQIAEVTQTKEGTVKTRICWGREFCGASCALIYNRSLVRDRELVVIIYLASGR